MEFVHNTCKLASRKKNGIDATKGIMISERNARTIIPTGPVVNLMFVTAVLKNTTRQAISMLIGIINMS